MQGLTNKVALVTGAARGIGFSIASRLAQEGAHTILTDISNHVNQSYKKIKAEFRDNMGFGALMDVTQKNEIHAVVEQILSKLGRVDILVNNAGILLQGLVLDTTEENWDLSMNVNTKSVFLCSQAVLPHMIRQKNGRIVNIASQAGKYAEVGIAGYCTSKAAVIRLTQCIALEMVEHNIRVNCVCPGATETDLVEKVFRERSKVLGISPAEMKRQFLEEIPMKRMAVPEDIANVVAFLTSDESAYMTGQALNVTGGRVCY
jgi:NAD(P)-dependent dehydrogenase (short-subunit alcohol dehydrogenase family)